MQRLAVMRTTTRRVLSALFGLTLMTTAGLSQVLSPRSRARSVPSAPLPSAELERLTIAKRGEPIELSVREDLRVRCSEFALPPEPALLGGGGSDEDARALEELAVCLTRIAAGGEVVEIIGPTELPGRREYPSEAAAPGDTVRSLLYRLGVPFAAMVTEDVPLDPFTSPHAAPRVVVGVAPPADS